MPIIRPHCKTCEVLTKVAELRELLGDGYADWLHKEIAPFMEIAPAPPKLREFWINWPHRAIAGWVYVSGHETSETNDKVEQIHVREISAEADAEIAEKLRNHDALCRAIKEWGGVDGGNYGTLRKYLVKHNVNLRTHL